MRIFFNIFVFFLISQFGLIDCRAGNPNDLSEPDTPIIIPIIIIHWPTGLETTSSDHAQHENLVEDNDENITLNTNTNIPAFALGTVNSRVPRREMA